MVTWDRGLAVKNDWRVAFESPPKSWRWKNSIILGFTLRKEQKQVWKPESIACSITCGERSHLSMHCLHILNEAQDEDTAIREKKKSGQFWASLFFLCPKCGLFSQTHPTWVLVRASWKPRCSSSTLDMAGRIRQIPESCLLTQFAVS